MIKQPNYIWNGNSTARNYVALAVCKMSSTILSTRAKLQLLEKIFSRKPSIEFYVTCLYSIERPCTYDDSHDTATLYSLLTDKNRELVTKLIMSRGDTVYSIE